MLELLLVALVSATVSWRCQEPARISDQDMDAALQRHFRRRVDEMFQELNKATREWKTTNKEKE